jgi:hypothetical protein
MTLPLTQIHDVTPNTQIHDVTPNTQLHDVIPSTQIYEFNKDDYLLLNISNDCLFRMCSVMLFHRKWLNVYTV